MVILIIITALAVIATIIGIVTDSVNWGVSGVILLLFTGIFGWGVIGTLAPMYHTKVPCNVVKVDKIDGYGVVVNYEYNDTFSTKLFNETPDFNNITDSTKFYIKQSTNLYGVELLSSYDLKYEH